jgi:DNA-binding NtrC family response regulator
VSAGEPLQRSASWLQAFEEVERRYILRVVEACKGNESQAARVLGIGARHRVGGS